MNLKEFKELIVSLPEEYDDREVWTDHGANDTASKLQSYSIRTDTYGVEVPTRKIYLS